MEGNAVEYKSFAAIIISMEIVVIY